MKYGFARFAIFCVRLVSWVVFVPSILEFLWCLVLIVPPVAKNGFNEKTIRDGRGGIEQQQRSDRGQEDQVLSSLNMGTSEVSTGLLAGSVALALVLVTGFLLVMCDVFKAVIDTAINTSELLKTRQSSA